MGDDFTNHQVFANDDDRPSLIQVIRSHFEQSGYAPSAESEFGRSVAVGPATDWIPILDSAGTEWEDNEAFTDLSVELSRVWPVVDIATSDSAAISLALYSDGKLVDQFRNLDPPFYAFPSEEKALKYRGDTQTWIQLVANSLHAGELRTAWPQGLGSWADQILDQTAELLGWHPHLCQVKYDEHYKSERHVLTGIEEFHFTPKNM